MHNGLIKTELYSGLECVWKSKKLLVSGPALRCLLPKQVKKFTPRYKQMRGCKICIHCKQLQRTLNSCRKRHDCNKHCYKYVVFSDDNVLNLSPIDAINGMLCPKQSSSSLPKWNCVLQQSVSCPKYTISDYESSYISVPPKIKFHQYVLFSAFFIHGLIGEGRLIYNLCEAQKLKVRYEVEIC